MNELEQEIYMTLQQVDDVDALSEESKQEMARAIAIKTTARFIDYTNELFFQNEGTNGGKFESFLRDKNIIQ